MDKSTFYDVYRKVYSPNYKGFKDKKKKEKKEEEVVVKKPLPDYCEEGILNLRNAIVKDVVKSYKKSLIALNLGGVIKYELWFKGPDFKLLSMDGVDGNSVIRDLRKFQIEEEDDKIKELEKNIEKYKKKGKQSEIDICELKIKKSRMIKNFIKSLDRGN